MRKTLWVVLAVAALAGCDKGNSYVTWDTGLHVAGKMTSVEVKIDYRSVQGQDREESSGAIDAGNFAGQSKGTTKVTTTTTSDLNWQVVGQFDTANHAFPGMENGEEAWWDEAPVALVEAVSVDSTTSLTEKTTVDEVKGQYHVLAETSETGADRNTKTSTWGLTGEDWVLLVSDLSLLWDAKTPDAAVAAKGKVLVKANVQVGDTWASDDGKTLYKAIRTEDVPVGDHKVGAVKVELRRIFPVGDTNLVDACLTVTADTASRWTQDGPSGSGEGENADDVVRLDGGCEGGLQHGSEGFQWWHDNVLVKEDVTVWESKIKDWGFEWYTGNGATAARHTAKTLSQANQPDALLFVESTLTQTHRTFETTKYENVATPWAK